MTKANLFISGRNSSLKTQQYFMKNISSAFGCNETSLPKSQTNFNFENMTAALPSVKNQTTTAIPCSSHDTCPFDDMVSKIVEDDQLKGSFLSLQSHPNHLTNLMDSIEMLPPLDSFNAFGNLDSILATASCFDEAKQDETALTNGHMFENSMENFESASALDFNFYSNSSFGSENIDLPSTLPNVQNKIFQGIDNFGNAYFSNNNEENACGDILASNGQLMSINNAGPFYQASGPTFQDSDPLCNVSEQQAFWVEELSRQMSEAINIASQSSSRSLVNATEQFAQDEVFQQFQFQGRPLGNLNLQSQSTDLNQKGLNGHSEPKCNNSTVMINSFDHFKENISQKKHNLKLSSYTSVPPNLDSQDYINSVINQNGIDSNGCHNELHSSALAVLRNSSILSSGKDNHNNNSAANCQRNQNLSYYQNFPKNVSNKHVSSQKALTNIHSHVENDSTSLNAARQYGYNLQNNDICNSEPPYSIHKSAYQKASQLFPNVLSNNTSGNHCDFINLNKHTNDIASLEKSMLTDNEKARLKDMNLSRYPAMPEIFHRLSAQTIAELYAAGLGRDNGSIDANNLSRRSLSFPSAAQYSQNRNNATTLDRPVDIRRPYEYMQRHLSTALYSTNEACESSSTATFYPVTPPFIGTRSLRRSGSSNELHIRLEECYEQFRQLKK